MAIVPWSAKDSTLTYNSTDLSAWVTAPPNLKFSAGLNTWTPMGSAYPTSFDSGQRALDAIQVTFVYDGAAAAPNVKCALATSSTLTIVLGTGHSVACTAIVQDQEVQITETATLLVVTFQPSVTITWDLAT